MKHTSRNRCKVEAFTSCPGKGRQPAEMGRLNSSGLSVHKNSFEIAGSAYSVSYASNIIQYVVYVKA